MSENNFQLLFVHLKNCTVEATGGPATTEAAVARTKNCETSLSLYAVLLLK